MTDNPSKPVPGATSPGELTARVTQIRRQLEAATTGPGLAVTAHEIFCLVLALCRAHENPADPRFASFVMAAAHAANGRDAIGFTPGFPPGRLTSHQGELTAGEDGTRGTSWPEQIGDLCRQLAASLTRAGSTCGGREKLAYVEAARCARNVSDLLSGCERAG